MCGFKMEGAKKAEDGSSKEKTLKEPGSSSSKSLSRKNIISKAFQLLENQGIIVGKTLGSGSYAKVKSAYDINRKHKVAIKIICKKKAFDEYLQKFLPREIEAMKALNNHHALVQFYQVIETTSRFFFVMEMAENGDLLSVVKTRDKISEDDAGQWFVNLYEGLKYMHSKGFVHRDIKCENLVIDKQNNLKLTDFGFAKRIGKAKGGGPLLSETYCGSYAYASPEILKGIPYDPVGADVWSMGVVLFTMVYGRMPYDDSDHKRLLKQVEKKVNFPSNPDISKGCRILIVKILSKASDRVPLKNMNSDPWFKEQKSFKILNRKSEEVLLYNKLVDSQNNPGESKTDTVPVTDTSKGEGEITYGIEDTQTKLQIHSMESNEDLKVDEFPDNGDNEEN